MADLTVSATPEAIYKASRLQAETEKTAFAQLMALDFSDPQDPEKGELPGLAEGLSNALGDLNPVSALKGFTKSVGTDTLHGLRMLFSPGESFSAAVLSQFNEDESDSAMGAAAQAMKAALTNQPGRNLAGEVAEYQFPDQGKAARAATELGLSLVIDPTMYVGIGLIPALRKGIRRVGMGKSHGPFTGAIDDLVENVNPANATELYNLAARAEKGDKAAAKSLETLLGPHAKDWELASVNKDYYRLTTVGGEAETIPVKASRLQKKLQAKRAQGDPVLFLDELDSPVGNPYRFNELHLNMNGPEDVVGLGQIYEAETVKYVEEALKKFPEGTIEGGMIRGTLREQPNLLADSLGEVLNKPLTDIQAFAYRRLLSDISENVLAQVNKSEMKFRSNVDRLRFYKLVGMREQIRAELSLSKNQGSALLSKLTTASSNKAVRVVQAERAINKIPEMLSGAEERYLAQGLANLENGDQATVFLNQIFSPGNAARSLEKNFHTYWVNSILSGPVTHGRNAVVNGLNILLKPVEHAAVGDFAVARQQAIGMIEGTMDVFRIWARRSPKQPMNYKEYRNMHELSAHTPKLSTEAMKQLPLYQKGWHFLTTNIIGGPTKALGEADALFKAVAQRQDVRGQAVNLASRLTQDPAVRKQLIQRFLRNPMQLMEKKAFVNAEKLTFQNPLTDRATGVHQAASRYPATKWLTPFVKTPLNIATMGMRYTPYAPLFKQVRQDILKGGVDADLAIARMMVMPSVATGIAFTLGDNVTGGQNEYNNQNQLPPYSVKIDGKWLSYRKIEPLRWVLGPAADLKDLYNAIDWDASDAQTIWGQAIAGVTGAYLKPVMDTLFLNTVADVVVAVSDGSNGNWGRLIRIAENYIGGLAPNAATQLNRIFIDTDVKQLDDHMSRLKNRVPGLSKTLPPKYGFLGEKQKHSLDVRLSQAGDHRVYLELQLLSMDIPQPPKIINGHELNMYERTYFRAYKANPKMRWSGMVSLADAYDELFETALYREASKDEKRELIQKLSNDYNNIAKQIVVQDNPRLQEKAR